MTDLSVSATSRMIARLHGSLEPLLISLDDYQFYKVSPKKLTVKGNTKLELKNISSSRIRGFSYDRIDLSRSYDSPPTGYPLGLENLPTRTTGLVPALSDLLKVEILTTDIVDEPIVNNYMRVRFTDSCLLYMGSILVNITG